MFQDHAIRNCFGISWLSAIKADLVSINVLSDITNPTSLLQRGEIIQLHLSEAWGID